MKCLIKDIVDIAIVIVISHYLSRSSYDTTSTNTYLSLKDRMDKELQSSVVYKFSYPACQLSYIGKTDRCPRTRIKEHSSDKNSEVHKHIMSCEHFQYFQTLLKLTYPTHYWISFIHIPQKPSYTKTVLF